MSIIPPAASSVTTANPVSAKTSRPGDHAVRPAIKIGSPSFGLMYQGCLSPFSPVHSYQPSAGTIIRRDSSGFQNGEPFKTVSSRALLAGPLLYQGGLYPQNTLSAWSEPLPNR